MSDQETAEILTHLQYIRGDLQEMKTVLKSHDEDIRDAKASIRIIKWLGGLVTAGGAFFGFGGHHG